MIFSWFSVEWIIDDEKNVELFTVREDGLCFVMINIEGLFKKPEKKLLMLY
jgi:hypothetical protein